MKVRAARVAVGARPVSARNANRAWSERRFAHVVFHTENGAIGMGEASPLEGYSRDSFASSVAELRRAARALVGFRLDRAGATVALGRRLRALRLRSASAAFAVESALLDALAREEGQPVFAILRGGRRAARVEVSGLVTSTVADDAAAQARAAVARGVRTLKLKIGPRIDADLARVAAVRAAAPRAVLRLDANQSCDAASFAAARPELARLRVALVEEPVGPSAWRALAPSAIRLAMDESLLSRGWQARARARSDLAALVLKPMALGGFLRCLELAAFAARNGWKTYVTHMFDGPVAAAAAAELALALPGAPLACGLDVHGRDGDWPPHRFARLGASAVVPNGEPGLGVELDVSALG